MLNAILGMVYSYTEHSHRNDPNTMEWNGNRAAGSMFTYKGRRFWMNGTKKKSKEKREKKVVWRQENAVFTYFIDEWLWSVVNVWMSKWTWKMNRQMDRWIGLDEWLNERFRSDVVILFHASSFFSFSHFFFYLFISPALRVLFYLSVSVLLYFQHPEK